MKRIAFSGMKGRKRDTFLLGIVIFLSFVFVITSIVFHASSEKTKVEQRENAFGAWENAYFNGGQYVEKRLQSLESVEKIGKSRIVGRSNQVGLVGSIDDKLKDMGNFQFESGRMPENQNEIAIELNQLSNFSGDIKIGDKIPLQIDITLFELDDNHEDLEAPIKERQDRFMENLKSHIMDPDSSYYEFFKDTDIDKIETTMDFLSLENFDVDLLYSVLYEVSSRSYLFQNTRNTQDMQHFDDVMVELRKEYVYWFIGDEDEDKSTIENIEENGVKTKERLILTKEMTVSGIINTYSDRWDIDNFGVANAFITEDAATSFIEGGIYKTENAQVELYKPSNNFFMVSENSSQQFYNENKDKFKNLKRNTYAFPGSSASTDNVLTYGILALIFLGTIFSVFQIYLTQMKRRTRKIALLKAIGGTNSQVRKILFWEVLFLLVFIVPLSIVVGLLTVKVIIIVMNNFRGSQTVFYLDVKLLALGILAAIVSVFVGMAIPMIKSMKVPLRGDISGPPKRRKKSAREVLKLDKGHKIKRQSFSQISKRHNKYNRGKNLLTLSLYTITIVVLLATIFSGFLSFGEYIDMVLAPNKPDFQFKVNYGMRTSDIDDLVDEVKKVQGIEDVYGYKYGQGGYLWYEGIENNEIINSYRDLLPVHLREESFGVKDDFVNLTDDNKHIVTEGLKVSSYGVEVGSLEYNNFINAIDQGKIDEKAYKNGEEVIVLMPMYKAYKEEKIEIDKGIIENTNSKNRMAILLSDSKSYDLSYDFRNSGYYNINNYLSVGQKLHLTVPTENIEGEYPTNDVRFIEVKVGGIINYFPEQGIWPFSNTIENPLIIGANKLIHEMYPASRSGIIQGAGRPTMEQKDIDALVATLRPTSLGNTLVTISTNNKFDEIKGFIDVQRIGNEAGMPLEVLLNSNIALKDKALRTSIIIGVLGISIALISLIILYNTSLSNIDQERERIGILQGLGVDGDSFKKLYFTTGLKYGLIAITIAHIFIILVLIITTIIEVGSINLFLQSDYLNVLKNKVWMYPWKLHIGTCIVFLIWTVITYYIPIRKIVKNQAVDNIRSLTR